MAMQDAVLEASIPTALITGACGGIGQALCHLFRTAGYWVIGLDQISSPVDCDALVVVDLARLCRDLDYREGAIATLRSHLPSPHLTVLINNAALQIVKPTDDLQAADWHQTLDVNLIAPFLLTQAFLPELEQAGGSVINMASIHATATKPEFVCYATSKAALVGLTKSLAVDLGGRVRVNAICPAAVATPMLLAGFEGREGALQNLSEMHPINRIATPEEIAQTALFLASPQASFITGSALYVDGGIGGRLHDPV